MGNILDVLTFKSSPGNGSKNLKELLDIISASSLDHPTITSADMVGFGLGVNEGGNNKSNILFQEVSMSFEYPSIAGDINSQTQTITFNFF